MDEAPREQPAPLPPGVDLLWGKRERGKRGPRAGLSADAIVEAAIRVADAGGLEAVSMARVAAELGVTTMALYRHVASKDELLQLMWNGSAIGVEKLVIEGDTWRDRLRAWALVQWDMLSRHPWVTQMPIAAPPLAPNSLYFVEHGLATMDDTRLPDSDKLSIVGLVTTFMLSEARMAHDAARAAAAAPRGASGAAAGDDSAGDGAGPGVDPPPFDYGLLIRQLVDEETFPRLHRLAWAPQPGEQRAPTETEEMAFGLEVILDGVQALIDRGGTAGP